MLNHLQSPFQRLAILVGKTERESRVGEQGWHGSFTGLFSYFAYNERKKKDKLVN